LESKKRFPLSRRHCHEKLQTSFTEVRRVIDSAFKHRERMRRIKTKNARRRERAGAEMDYVSALFSAVGDMAQSPDHAALPAEANHQGLHP
jgi:hypothetical protein